jgi:hypothetical protein
MNLTSAIHRLASLLVGKNRRAGNFLFSAFLASKLSKPYLHSPGEIKTRNLGNSQNFLKTRKPLRIDLTFDKWVSILRKLKKQTKFRLSGHKGYYNIYPIKLG